ncbi:MAG TPA: hypothetical protein ENN91_02000 [Firmicutes bacterium]|nr:hypothetical protein [Bacillota bacterium]
MAVDQEKKKELRERVLFEAENEKMPCKKAFKIAEELNCLPIDVGKECNELEIKIVGCQLGCF